MEINIDMFDSTEAHYYAEHNKHCDTGPDVSITQKYFIDTPDSSEDYCEYYNKLRIAIPELGRFDDKM